MNKKRKSTNTSPYPDEVIDRLARAFYPAILACWNSEEGQREFAAWQKIRFNLPEEQYIEHLLGWIFKCKSFDVWENRLINLLRRCY